PGLAPDHPAHRNGEEAYGPYGDDVSEGDHHRRQEDGHEQRRLQPAAAGKVGAHDQEREECSERDRDGRHPRGDDEGAPERAVEVGVDEHELIRGKRQLRAGLEERTVEKALVEDDDERSEDGGSRQQHHRHPAPRPAAHGYFVPSACCHCLRNSSRFAWSRYTSSDGPTGSGFNVPPSSLVSAEAVASPSTSSRMEKSIPFASSRCPRFESR